MTIHRTINLLLALAIAAIMSTAYLLDGPTDHQAAQAQANSLLDARQAARADVRMANARKAAGVAL
jgi:hypothetical protein